MQPLYGQDGTTLIGYSTNSNYAVWTYNTSWQLQGISLDAAAISSGALTPVVANNVTTSYTYTESSGTVYTYSVDAQGALTGYTTTYSGVGYSYTYNYDAMGAFSGYSHVDGNITKTYDASYNLVSTVTATPANMVAIQNNAGATIGYSVTDQWGTTTEYALDQLTVTGYRYTYLDTVNNTTSVSTYDANWNYLGSETRNTTTNAVLYSDSYSYDANGKFAGYTYFDGVTTTVYDANWNVVSSTASTANLTSDGAGGFYSTDAWGTTTTFDSTGQVTGYRYSYTNWDNSKSVTSYDTNWNYLGSETRDAQGNLLYSNTYTYVNGVFSGYTYFDGTTTTVYDANWNVVSSTANITNLTQILDANNQLIGYSKTDQWGTTTTYDTSGALTGYSYRYTNWDSSVSVTTYDAKWNYLSSETRDAQGNLLYSTTYSYVNGVFNGYTYTDGVTTTVYDANWNVVSSTANTANLTPDGLGGFYSIDAWGTTTTYDSIGQVTGYRYSYTNWDNSVSVTSYDAKWNYLGSETRDTLGNLLYSNTYSYVNGVFSGYTYFDGVTTTVYDANWNVVSSTASTANLTSDGAGGFYSTDAWGTTTTYDSTGHVTGYRYSYTNWDNSKSVTSYDANWNYLSSETRDAQGNLLYSNTYSYVNGVFSGYSYFDGVTTTVYDANWNVVSSTASTANLTQILDANNQLIGYSKTDAYGTTTMYDTSGAVTGYSYRYTNWDSSVSVTSYDASWNYLSSETRDAQGNLLYSNTYSYVNGVFSGYSYFDGVTTTVYDANWNVVSSTVSTANMTQLLDVNNQLIGYSHTDQWGTTTTYDLNGLVTSYRYNSVDSVNNTTTVTTYDKNWYFISSVTTNNTSGAELYRSEYTYDAAGTFTGYTYFDGVTTTVYNAAWQVVSSTTSLQNMVQIFDANNLLTGYRFTDAWGTTTYYDTNGVKTGSVNTYVDSWNNTTTVTTYGANGNYLSSETRNTTTGTLLSSNSYSYDQAGNFTGYTNFDGVTTTVYNASWQVVSSTTSLANLTAVHDVNNVLTGYTYTDAWGTTTYYDTSGVKTGSSYSYTNWDGTKSVSHYDKNGSYTGWSNTDAQGNVLSSSLYNYDPQGNYVGYTYFDGVITTVYDAWGVVIGTPTVDLTRLTLNAAQDGYYRTDASGTTTYYDLQGAKTGSSYSYTNWDGTKSISHYDASGSYIGWSNTDALGNVLSSNLYNYDQNGFYAGYTYFDGITTTIYDSFGYVLSSSIDVTKLTLNAAQDGYYRTDTSGTTTYYDLLGAKTGSSYSYTNWDGTKSISHYDASGSYIGWSNTDAQGNVLSSSLYNYQNGSYVGYTYFDGITTTIYDSFGGVLSSSVDVTKLTLNAAQDGYYRTDASGTTTYYDLLGAKTGSSYSYTYADGTKSISHYNASGSYIGWSNTDAQGKVLSSSLYNYDQGGNHVGYTNFDGVTTTVYDTNWNILSATADTANMTPVLDATNSIIGYSHTDQWGTTTYYNLSGAKTGSSSSYTNWDGTISHSHYNASGNYIGWSNTDVQGNVLSSNLYNYDQQGNYIGYTYFDGITTTVYDASGYVLSATASTANMTPVLDANNVLVGYSHTDTYGMTTYYDTLGAKTGSSNSYTNWDGTKNISYYNAVGAYIGWSNTDAQGNVLRSSQDNYDQFGTYLGYTYFDGVTTTVYDAWGAVIGTPTVNTASMTPLDANGNALVDANHDGFDDVTNTAVAGYRHTDAYGTTSTYDLNGTKTGYSYTYHDSWNNTTYVSTYKADGTFLKSVNTAADGTVLYSEEYLFNPDGTPAGRVVFDGANTFTYDASGNLLTDVGPYPISMTLNSDGITIDFSEIAYAPANPADLAFTMLKNGDPALPMNIVSFTGDGTASFTIHTNQTLATGDWVLLNYTGSTVANGIRDALGNVMQSNAQTGYGGSAEGSSADNVIDLSNATIFSAPAGYDISGGLGNDTIIGSAGSDYIMGGAGADTLTGGAASGDQFNFVQDGANQITYNGSAYVAAGGALDRITDFSSGDSFSLNVADSFAPGSMPTGLSMMNLPPMDGLAADQSYFMVQGNYNAGQFSVNGTTGTDTLVVYDSDATAGVSQSGIVLSGVTLGQLGAQVGSNYVSYIGGVTPPPGGGTTPPPVGGTDIVAPTLVDAWASSVGGSITFVFDEPLVMGAGGTMTAYINGVTPMTITGGAIDPLFPNQLTVTTSTALTPGDIVIATYNAATQVAGLTDAANNRVQSGTIAVVVDQVIAGPIDLQALQLPADVIYPIFLRGNGSANTITGSNGNDVIDPGRGADVVNGGGGMDQLWIGESTSAIDTVVLMSGESTVNAPDLIQGFSVNGVQVVKHTVPANAVGTSWGNPVPTGVVSAGINDVLNLPSNAIAADVVNAVGVTTGGFSNHTIAGGMVTFSNAASQSVMINSGNYSNATAYLAANITTGDTVAFVYDSDNNGAGDSVVVFQKDANADIAAILDMTTGSTAFGGVGLTSGDLATGLFGDGFSKSKSISGDGRFVVFESDSTNLVANDTNGVTDVFMKDMTTGVITRLSESAANVQANDFTWASDTSADGRYVAMVSDATNLIAGDTNGMTDAFIKDTVSGTVTLASADAAGNIATGAPAGFGSDVFDISGDGRYVLMSSDATNLVANDTNGIADIFLKDMQTGTVQQVAATADSANYDVNLATNSFIGTTWSGLGGKVTEDGRYVIFESAASNLVANDTNGMVDIFKKDMQTGAISLVSSDVGGNQATGGMSFDASGVNNTFFSGISADGRYVVFQSDANNLVAGDTNNAVDIFMKDTQTGTIIRVNTDANNAQAMGGNSFTSGRSVSADGRFVVFQSNATNLVWGDGNQRQDVFIKDTLTGDIQLLDGLGGGWGTSADRNVGGARISADGTRVSYHSAATNLVAGDVNAQQDVFTANNPFLVNVTNVTLGTTAGINVVQLADTTAPQINAARIAGANSVELQFSENVTVDPNAAPGSILLNGSGTSIVGGATVAGNVVTVSTTAAIQPTDFLIMTTGNNVADASGNVAAAGQYAIIGGDGDNTMDLHTSGFSLYMGGFGGNDTIIGSALSDDIEGGEGADTITGGGGQDNIWLGEMTAASDTVVINAGDSTTNGNDFVYGFDVSSATNDVLNLPSSVIAADTAGFAVGTQSGAIVSHSITNGMISFGNGTTTFGVITDQAVWNDALNYMKANIADGQTVAAKLDLNGDGVYAVDVFQGNATNDILVQIVDPGLVNALSNTAQMSSVTII